MLYPITSIYNELLENRAYLIAELGVTFDGAELLKLSGRIFELERVIKIIEETEGA